MNWYEGVRRPDHDEFVSWTSATKIDFPVGAGLQDRLVARLKSGEVEAAANANWSNGTAKHSTGPLVLVPRWWSGVDGGHTSHYANLWKTGQITLFVPDSQNGTITQVQFSSVRFKPSELAVALDPDAPPARRPPPAASTARSVAPRDYVPETDDDEAHFTPEEFERWHKPSAVLQLLPRAPTEVKHNAIALRMQDGAIRTAVGEVRTLKEEVKYRREVGINIWAGWSYHTDPDFWSYGIRVVTMGRTEFRLYDVRLHPGDVAKLLQQTGATPPDHPQPEPRAARPEGPAKVDHRPIAKAAELEALVQRYGAAHPDAPYSGFMSEAVRSMPNRRVTQRPLRAAIAKLGFSKSRGNPTIKRQDR